MAGWTVYRPTVIFVRGVISGFGGSSSTACKRDAEAVSFHFNPLYFYFFLCKNRTRLK